MKNWKHILRITLIGILVSNVAYPFELIQKGSPAPYTGFIMPVYEAQQARKGLIERDAFEEMNQSLEISMTILTEDLRLCENKARICLEQNHKLATQLESEISMTTGEKVFWASIGVVTTLAIGYGIKKAFFAD